MPRVYTTRKRKTSKRTYRKRRPFNMTRRKTGKSGSLRLVRFSSKDTSKNVHYTVTGNNLVPSNYFALTFALEDINGVGELKSLFDNYRITKVLYRFVMERDPSSLGAAGSTGVGNFPRINWVHDFNDSTAITRQQMMQHAGMREFWFTESRQHSKWYSINVSSLVQQYESPSATAYKPVWKSWVDTTDSAMPHYGLKIAYDNLYSSNYIYVEAKYVIECKGIS